MVISNVFYQICAKSVPGDMNPFLVGAVCSFGMYLLMNKDANIIKEYAKLNWAPFVLGLVIIGLEAVYITQHNSARLNTIHRNSNEFLKN